MKVDYINAFINSTVNALSTMALMEPVRGKPYLKTDNLTCDISATIGVTGQATGSVTINFSEHLAIKMIENMLGITIGGMNEDVMDAVGEMVNMIAGGAKAELLQQNLSFKIALPVVCVGKTHTTKHPKDVQCIVIPFTLEGSEFTVEVALKMNGNE